MARAASISGGKVLSLSLSSLTGVALIIVGVSPLVSSIGHRYHIHELISYTRPSGSLCGRRTPAGSRSEGGEWCTQYIDSSAVILVSKMLLAGGTHHDVLCGGGELYGIGCVSIGSDQ